MTRIPHRSGADDTYQLPSLYILFPPVALQPFPQLTLSFRKFALLGQDPRALQMSLVKIGFQLQEPGEIRQGGLMTALREVGGRSEVVQVEGCRVEVCKAWSEESVGRIKGRIYGWTMSSRHRRRSMMM